MPKAKRPSLTELIWLFIIGCLIGFFIETLWYFIKHGILINKQGLLYGPFKPIYGLGFVIIVLIMSPFKDKKIWQKFILGVLIGSVFEFLSSIFQEYIFGTSTWNYASFNFNIGGRIYLPYCLIWGIIALFAIDYLYPLFKEQIKIIPPKLFKILTIIVAIFMSINIVLTVIATVRYADRNKNNSNTVFKVIDQIYDDNYMKNKFPKLKIIKN